MKICISYANKRMRFKQRFLTHTALTKGGVDKVIEYSPRDLDLSFVRKNKHILRAKRGAGYWLWKPYIIFQALTQLSPDDILLYADAGCFFIQPMDPWIEAMRQTKQDLLPFDKIGATEKCWTKRDAFLLMDCDSNKYRNTRHRLGGIHLWYASAFTLNFAQEWLKYAQDERIITDIPNQCGKENYPNFVEHRHDQSIFSLLTKKYNLSALKYDTTSTIENPVYSNRITAGFNRSDFHHIMRNYRKSIIPLDVMLRDNIKLDYKLKFAWFFYCGRVIIKSGVERIKEFILRKMIQPVPILNFLYQNTYKRIRHK